jgi:hypothetical protein
VIHLAFARPGIFVRLAGALALSVLAACSSSVSGPTAVEDPNRVTIQPETAVLYSGLPTTFTVSGGVGTYSITSSNQGVLEVPSFLNGRTFTVTPASVAADTSVTVTVRDSGTAPLANAALTVRPGTVANEITITPTGTQGGNCAPAICSGGDGIVFARISQGGSPLPGRGVRLTVVSGDFRFITSVPGQAEVQSTSTDVISDQAGGVLARIRALPGANNQSAVVQVTDLGTNAFQRVAFTIAQATGSSPGFFTVPDSFTFTGPNNLQCATATRADVSIFGGSPPYTIGNGGSFFGVSQNVVTSSGGSFYVVATGGCADNVPITVVDSAGRTAVVSVSNVLGTATVPALVVSPSSVTISQCSGSASVTVAGGIPGRFTVSSGSPAISVSANPSTGLISIIRTPNVVATSPILVGVASGDKTAQITVNLTGDAVNSRCDGSSMTVLPSSLTFTGCGSINVLVSGGVNPYLAFVDNSSVTISPSLSPNSFTVTRPSGSAAIAAGSITFSDSVGTRRTVPVTVSGTCL